MTPRLVLPAADVVGESPVWDDRRNCLIWVDIIGRRIHRLNPATGAHETWPTPGRVTSIGLRADGGAIVGLERHLALWDWGDEFRTLCEVEPELPGNRLNEGAVGPDGAFWVGTMQNNIGPDDGPVAIAGAQGSIYRLAPDLGLTRVCDDRFGITNTFVWPAPDRFVTADSLENALYSYRVRDGRLEGRRLFQTGFPRGVPDGSCIDAEGFLWTARVAGGACLTRSDPEGRIVAVVDLPCSWPTSCAFGGPGLATLFVTSARFTMSPAHLAAHPEEGGLFALEPGPRGLPAARFG
jgi:sugar lactone lactonase YvrE